MRLKVVGWVSYDDHHFADGDITYAAQAVIVDDIKKNKYCFTGWHHQEMDCCVPVLSDGKARRYSQRGWGGVMAEAWGYKKPMDYSLFAFYAPEFDYENGFKMKEDPNIVIPKKDIYDLIYDTARDELSEEEYEYLFEGDFTINFPHPELGDREIYTLTQEEASFSYSDIVRQIPNVVYNKIFQKVLPDVYVLDGYKCIFKDDYVVLKMRDEFRNMACGDTIKIGDKSYEVKGVKWDKNVSEKIRETVSYCANPGYEEAVEIYVSADEIIKIYIV